MIAAPELPPQQPAMVFEQSAPPTADGLPQIYLPENFAPLNQLKLKEPSSEDFKITPAFAIQTVSEGEPSAVAQSRWIATKTVGRIATDAIKRSKFSTPVIFIQNLPRTETTEAGKFTKEPSENSILLETQIKESIAKKAKKMHLKTPKVIVDVLPDRTVDARTDPDVMDDIKFLADSATDYPELAIPNFGYMQSAIKQGKVAELPAVARQVFDASTRNNGIIAVSIAGVSKKPAVYNPQSDKKQ